MTKDVSGIPAKTVLLIDVNSHSRAARARILREMGMMVDCAATTGAGLSRLKAGHYNLVLVDVSKDRGAAESLVAEIKAGNPRQLVAFLVGSPLFVVKSLKVAGLTPRATESEAVPREAKPAAARTSARNQPLRMDFGRRVRQAQAEAEEVA